MVMISSILDLYVMIDMMRRQNKMVLLFLRCVSLTLGGRNSESHLIRKMAYYMCSGILVEISFLNFRGIVNNRLNDTDRGLVTSFKLLFCYLFKRSRGVHHINANK